MTRLPQNRMARQIVRQLFDIWKEGRYMSTPWPEYRIRVRLLGLVFTLYQWTE